MGLPRPAPSGRRGSNSRPQPWQGCALPTELRPPASGRRFPVLEVRQNLSRWSPAHKLGTPGRSTGSEASRLAALAPQPPSGRMPPVRAWLNGKVLEEPAGPAVAVSDHGLTVGDGVFEAVKAVNGRPFALTRHLERLQASAEGLGLPEPDLGE